MSDSAEDAPFHFINVFEIEPDAVDEFVERSVPRSRWIRSAEGYLGGHLYRAVPNDVRDTGFRLINVTHWVSREAFEAATSNPDYRVELEKLLGDLNTRMTGHGGYYEVAFDATPLPATARPHPTP